MTLAERLEAGEVLAMAAPVTHVRFLEYWFNPNSFWMLLDGDAPVSVIAEVSNTFGQRHSYLVPRPICR
ncbi:MAG TPA: DUF1365 family protein [Xanthobacteraceae bacterium]|nr:DUF1365 family protein [Xanthobacteraceae bacterium]